MQAPIPSGVYFIQNLASDAVLTLYEGSTGSGTAVRGEALRPLDDSRIPWQMWVITQRDAVYTIQNASGQTFIDLENGMIDDGTPLVGYPRNPSTDSQKWTITLDINQPSYYVIQNQASGTYMEFRAGSDNEFVAQIMGGDGSTTENRNQLWTFRHI